jgi:hypothetical protein
MYRDDQTFDSWSWLAQQKGISVITLAYELLNSYNEWLAFRNGRTDEQVATLFINNGLIKSQADAETRVAALNTHFSTLYEIYLWLNNLGTISESDRIGILRTLS